MLLSDTTSSEKVKLVEIKDRSLKIHLLKLGIQEGDVVTISHKVSHGPFILQHKSQEIALGSKNLSQIEVRHYSN